MSTNNDQTVESKTQKTPVVEEESKDPTTVELMTQMIHYFGRDQEIREGFLEQKNNELKHNKFRTRAMLVVFGFPLIFYVLILTDMIKGKWLTEEYVAMVSIEGVIHADKPASASRILPSLKKAYEDENAKGVIIRINSPGGSPVQSDLIHKAIVKYQLTYPDKKTIVVAEDAVASGGYWIASSVSEIYANEASVVGSIGVISESFGLILDDFFSNYGVERRVITSGRSKSRNDMFAELKDEDLIKTKESLSQIHAEFKQRVLSTRSGKITIDHDELFSGDYWTGSEAYKIGLIDGFGSVQSLAKEKIGVELVVDYSPNASFYDKLSSSFKSQIDTSLYLDIVSLITGKNFMAL